MGDSGARGGATDELRSLKTLFTSLYDITPKADVGYHANATDPHVNEADRTVGRVLTHPMPEVSSSGVVGRPR